VKSRSLFFASLLLAFPALLAALPYSEWRTAHFDTMELADSLVSGVTADPDGDGVVNLNEYVFFGEPLVGNTDLAPTLEVIDDAMTLTYREHDDLSDIGVQLQGSTTLSQWITYNTVVEVDRVSFTGYDEVTLLDPVAFTEGRRFLRLRVELLPPVEPRAPTQLSIGVITPTTWGLSWTDPNTTETGYAVERQLPPNDWERLATLGADTGSWQHTSADYQTSMIYRVVALGAEGTEATSEPITPLDSDADGIPNALELGGSYTGASGTYATDANQFSTGGSGVSDGWLVDNGFDPVAPFNGELHSDEDGLSDYEEYIVRGPIRVPTIPTATACLMPKTAGPSTSGLPCLDCPKPNSR
jgi:hypothetical protein